MSALAARMSAELGAGVVSRLAALEAASRGLRAPGELARIRTDLLAVLRMWQRLLTRLFPVITGRDPGSPGSPSRWPRLGWGRDVMVARATQSLVPRRAAGQDHDGS